MSTTSHKNGNTLFPLEAEAASINTATISIKTVQVGRKQMTQSVFRQLPAADLVDEDRAELLGVPWGWVNYYWGDISARSTQFIHQIGGRLYRCAFPITESRDFDGERYDASIRTPDRFRKAQKRYRSLIFALWCARILEGWRPESWRPSTEEPLGSGKRSPKPLQCSRFQDTLPGLASEIAS